MPRRLIALVATSLLAGTAAAADIEAGRVRAAQACAVCHGQIGISTAPDAPNLAGQPALYVASQLRAYRNGSRKHEVMGVISKTLSDDDIHNLAAWFASIRVEAHAPGK